MRMSSGTSRVLRAAQADELVFHVPLKEEVTWLGVLSPKRTGDQPTGLRGRLRNLSSHGCNMEYGMTPPPFTSYFVILHGYGSLLALLLLLKYH